jgi:hypothetical protein
VKSRNEYIELRRRYEPEGAALVIIAESPPASGRYFYDPAGAVTEPLFAELMRAFQLSPVTKDEGLRAFQRAGLVLIDATYEPVNQGHSRSDRDAVIARDYVLLRDDLAAFGNTPLVRRGHKGLRFAQFVSYSWSSSLFLRSRSCARTGEPAVGLIALQCRACRRWP